MVWRKQCRDSEAGERDRNRISPCLCFAVVIIIAMKISSIRTHCLVLILATLASAQDVIRLYPGTPPGSTPEN